MAHVTDFREAGFGSLSEELEWRGLISQSTDRKQLSDALDGEPITYYCGFDPTAASLHVGNLVQLINMRHLQMAGHHPIALVGGATGLIGDPRQSGERTLNPKETVAAWARRLKEQIGDILDVEGGNAVRFVSNYEWTADMSVIDFLRDVGKNFRLGTMLSKDTVARRLNSQDGISFTEFSYQVLQGNDFLHLFDAYHCVLQLGGNDQWGNLTSGLDLIRKVRSATVNVFTSPLITDSQGKKFGKSEGNAVWLDPTMLSPYRFYQFWINQPDGEMDKLLRAFTFLPKEEIERLAQASRTNPGAREAQRALAWEVTSLVHGEEETTQAIDASKALFGQGDINAVSPRVLESALEGLRTAAAGAGASAGSPLDDFIGVHAGERVAQAAVGAGLFPSVSQARKTIASGGVYVNNRRVEDQDQTLADADFLDGRFVLIRRGKKALGVAKKQ
ncbi:MAG: tyrosine--tRNA ligase [Bifidobacterium sp.]|jgi:tyrosyl-tRNA synthetase|nr:tyrosine--tRNA ligase [Bifidobacterium sp.]MCI1864553.1 tyrosine--tRNA ligase [Bifidobacterium sp.]